MAFKSKDGKKDFSMGSRKRAYDMGHPPEQMKAEPTQLSEPGQDDGMDEQDGSAVAAEHGPAQQVTMTHDDETGAHEVQSMHPDGHEHHSSHGSRKEAHEHAKKLAGADEEQSPESEPMEQGDEDY